MHWSFEWARVAGMGESCYVAPAGALLLHGGPIHVGVGGQVVEALLIRDGRVTYAGRRVNAPSAGAQEVNLRGAAAFPGLVDAHTHLLGVGLGAIQLELSGTPSIAALQAALGAYAARNRSGPIVGRGWIETHWPDGRMPTHIDLDRMVADRPVWLR